MARDQNAQSPEQEVHPDAYAALRQHWQSCLAWTERHEVRVALAATGALRLGCSGLAAVMGGIHPGASDVVSRYITLPWFHWDTGWYLAIAEHGYESAGETPFMPLYPLLIRVIGALIGGHLLLAALLISTGATFGALLCLHRLVTCLSANVLVADWTVVTAALLPVSFFLMAGYTESLFLWLALAAILASLKGHWAWAAAFAALAALTRHQGALLPIVFLPELVGRAQSWWRTGRQGAPWQHRLHAVVGPALAVCAPPFCYLLWWVGIVGVLLHGPLPWGSETLPNGWNLHTTWPGAGILNDLAALAQNKVPNPLGISVLLDSGMALLAGLGILLAARRLPPGIVLYAVVCWCLALLKVQSAGLTISTARYLIPLAPILIVPAGWLARGRPSLRLAWVGMAGVLLAVCAWLFELGAWIS